ncbi:MAG: ISNCY family transposase [Polaromonas sp.]
MRETIAQQLHVVPAPLQHERARELLAMSNVLDQLPQVVEAVHADLVRGLSDPEKGRVGMSAEQVLRVLILKQMKGISYDELSFELSSSLCYQSFCRFGIDQDIPKKTSLQRDCKRLSAQTLESINRHLLDHASKQKIEDGRKVRVDCTVQETNIHEPSDSSLLFDGVRKLTDLLDAARELTPVWFSDHRKRAKRRALAILNASTNAERLPPYRDLLKITRKTANYAHVAIPLLRAATPSSVMETAKLDQIAFELEHYGKLVFRVIEQTQRRVLHGESVPASEKIVSIFEEHTDIIVKDRRDTYYGHKLCLTTGASGLVLDCKVLDGNPADSTLAVEMAQRQRDLYDRPPRQVSMDGGFTSKANLADIKALGVRDVAFSKRRGLAIADMVKSTWVYRNLTRFRAGIESTISFLKRCFGLDRCTWRSLPSFKAYTWASVVAHNLLLLARHQLA